MLEKESTNLLEVKEKWEKIASHSAPGTLARSEAELILKMIEILKSEHGKDIEEISLKDLESISGGTSNKGNKTLASMLASVLALSSMPGASANFGTTEMPDETTRARSKEIFKDAATRANFKKSLQDIKKVGEMRDDGIAQLDKEGVNSKAASEIVKFCLIGQGQFEPPINSIESLFAFGENKKIFLTYMKELNRLLEKYSAVTKSLIEFHEINGTKFQMGFDKPPADNPGLRGASHPGKISFYAPESSYLTALYSAYSSYKSGYKSSTSRKKLLASTAAHEMGHLISFFIWINKEGMNVIESTSAVAQKNEFEEIEKEEIIEIAKNKYGCKDFSISKYGDSDPGEWFAEVFAHMECSDEDQLSPLGKAMRDYLQTTPYGVKS